jgi:hypothetical protein
MRSCTPSDKSNFGGDSTNTILMIYAEGGLKWNLREAWDWGICILGQLLYGFIPHGFLFC